MINMWVNLDEYWYCLYNKIIVMTSGFKNR